jgi:hypothetical protein
VWLDLKKFVQEFLIFIFVILRKQKYHPGPLQVFKILTKLIKILLLLFSSRWSGHHHKRKEPNLARGQTGK